MNWQVIKIRIGKISFYTLATFLFLLLSSYLTLQIPAVQNKLIGQYTDKLSQITGFTITANSFHLTWYDRIRIEGLTIIDPDQNTLLEAKAILINFRFRSLLRKGDINIDVARLDQVQFRVHSINTSDSTSTLNVNLLIDRINEAYGSSSKTSASQKINIGEIRFSQCTFYYDDHSQDTISTPFNPHRFEISLHEALLQNFNTQRDTIQFDVHTLKAKEETTNLEIHQLKSFFRISDSSMEFLNLNLQAGNSVITDTLIFNYTSQKDLSDFINRVSFQAHFEGTKISSDDLALFAPHVKSINQSISLRGSLKGKVSRFQFEKMEIAIGNTRLNGRLSIDGLPYIDESFINLKLGNSRLDFKDLPFLFSKNISTRLIALEQFQMNGSFIGFINDFVARGEFEGKIGKVKSDINLKINHQNIDESTYGGNITLTRFDLGRFFKDTVNFQKVTLKGKLDGMGFSLKSLDAKIDGTVESIGIRGYPYSNIKTNAHVAEGLFNGELSIDDPNLKLHIDGTVDFRGTDQKIAVTASLDSANFKNLGFVNDHLFVMGKAEINSTGLELDSILGVAKFYHSYIEYKDEALAIDTLQIESFKRNNNRVLQLKSSLVDIDLEGTYNYSDLVKDVPNFFYEFYLNLRNSHDDLLLYYSKKNDRQRDYELTYRIFLQDLNPLLDVLNINARISKETEIRGRFLSGESSILRAAASIKTIEFEGKKFLGTEIEFTGSKERDSTSVLAILTIHSQRQELAKQLSTKKLYIETIWNGPQMDGSLSVSQEGMDNVLRIQSYVDFLKDSTFIKLKTHQMRILGKDWEIDPVNFIVQKGKEWTINGLRFEHKGQSINLNGFISEDPTKELQLDITNLSLDIVEAISSEKFQGIVNGTLKSRDLYNDPYFQNDFHINELRVNDFLIGDVVGKNNWSQQKEIFDVQLIINRLGVNTFNIVGTYDPNLPTDPLALNAQLNQANLKMVEPILKGIFSNLSGDLSGSFSINGTFGNPRITGLGRVVNGALTVDYLKTPYSFEGNLELNPNMFVLSGFKLVDASGNLASLEGFVAHRNFSTFRMSIDADFKNFNVLNTTEKDNSLFYGVANATGNLNIFGPATNLKISATARSERNTKLFIPVGGAESTDVKEFISFVNFNESTKNKTDSIQTRKSDLSGITLDLNLDITPDAYAEIIFDIKSGDIIRGRGNGDLKLQLNTNGEFNMFGLVEFTEGAYNFTLYDIINKEFNVRPGSRISWFGDPYQGVLNLTATYRQLTSLGPILYDQTLADEPQIRRKYPVEVLLNLNGPMLSPEIEFDLEAKDLPDNVTVEGKPPVRLNFEFSAYKARIDEQELKRQVFSLIILRRFSPPESFNTSGSLAGSVSEFLSNQLSYWLSQVDENLEIDLDLGSLDPEAYNTFQLRLSYSFFNGRLRVTRDGSYSNQYRSDLAAIGDWTVDYLLTPDGKFRVKMFNRTNINAINTSVGSQNPMTTGFSIFHTQNFNDINELVGRARDRRKEEVDEEIVNEDIINQ